MGAHLHTVYLIVFYSLYHLENISSYIFRQAEESRADNISSTSKQVFAGKTHNRKKVG